MDVTSNSKFSYFRFFGRMKTNLPEAFNQNKFSLSLLNAGPLATF